MENQDISAVIAALEQAAAQGNAEAAYRLGLIYGNGDGTPLDYPKAAARFRQAAEAGHGAAMRALAMLHAAGYGVAQDQGETRRLLLGAAEAGDADAQVAVAAMFQFGQYGAEPDTRAMLHWYGQAAEQGNARAQFALGKLMAAGDRVQQNNEAAFQWLSLAILHGSEPAKKELAMLTARLDSALVETYKQRMLEHMQGG
jgi:TPR repeat protein